MRKVFLFSLICLSIFLFSCATPKERTYLSTEITYSEPTAQYAFKLNMDSTETEYAKYYFEPIIENSEREACIEVTEKVLSRQTFDDNVTEIYIFSNDRYNYKYICDHKLYCAIQNWKSVEYVTDVLITVYGESAHYGTAFGYANYLAKRNKWGGISSSFSVPSVNDILDLSYLCFDEDFTDPNDIAVAKEISCDFVNSQIKKHGEETIQKLLSSHSEALNSLSSYYTDKGISYFPSSVQYGYGGKKYDYLVYSDYGTFYIAKDWVDMHAEYNPLIADGFLHSDYSSTKTFFETNICQMKQYQDLFELDDYNNDLDIVFSNSISASNNSFYQSTIHRIYLYNVDSLMHEYIHSLTMPSASMASWKVEGFARYFSYYYDFYGVALLNYDYNNSPNTPEQKFIHEYLATINRPIDMTTDYREIENIAAYYFNYTNPNTNYASGSSFVQYLVKQYGEEAVINSIYGNGDPLPKTYAELVKGWIAYINSNYSKYGKYN